MRNWLLCATIVNTIYEEMDSMVAADFDFNLVMHLSFHPFKDRNIQYDYRGGNHIRRIQEY